MKWPAESPCTRLSTGSSVEQIACALGHRVWKRQPDGGLIGDGTSPLRMIRSRVALCPGRPRDGRQQRVRVRVTRRAVQVLDLGHLDDLAEVHHRDAVADVLHDREVVGDEEVGQAELALEVLEQVDDLRLDGDVERGDRLVADDELRVQRQGSGDADALALAAGELVRESGCSAPG